MAFLIKAPDLRRAFPKATAHIADGFTIPCTSSANECIDWGSYLNAKFYFPRTFRSILSFKIRLSDKYQSNLIVLYTAHKNNIQAFECLICTWTSIKCSLLHEPGKQVDTVYCVWVFVCVNLRVVAVNSCVLKLL